MKTLPLLLMLAPAVTLAVSPFDGHWKTRRGSFQTSYTFVFSVDAAEYRCNSCVPPVIVKPDGRFHKVSGHGYDNVAARIVDPSTVEVVERTGDKVLMKDTYTASQDGSQLRAKRIDESGEKPAPMQATLKRTAGTTPEKGKHPISGSWVLATLEAANVPMALRMTDESFSWSWNGQHYEARLDGKPVPQEGDPTHLSVSVRQVGANEVEETDTRDGKTVDQVVDRRGGGPSLWSGLR